MPSQWYFSRGTERYGPFSWDEMLKFAREGRIKPDDMVCGEANGKWLRADHITGLLQKSDSGYKIAEKPVKKRTPMIIGIVSITVLLTIGIVFLFINTSIISVFDPLTENPEGVVIAYWNAYKRMDLVEAGQYVSGDLLSEFHITETEYSDNQYILKMHHLLYGNLDLIVNDYTIDGNKAIVNAQVSAPDLETLLEEDEYLFWNFFGLYNAAITNSNDLDAKEIAEIDEFLKAFEMAILQAPKITEENNFILSLEDGEWKITDMLGSNSF